jgi:hypothetical protein
MNVLRILRKRPERSRRKAVYTFIFGDYDELKPPAIVTPGWDYICFTDDAGLRSDIWDVRLSPRTAEDRLLDNKRFAMKHHILVHQYLPGYDFSVALGAQLKLNCNVDQLMREHFRAGDDLMLVFWKDDCVYDEADGCKQRLTDDPERIDEHMRRYRAAGYPARQGLYMSGILARWHNRATVRAMGESWWQEYVQGSRRDQLSLSYAIWKSGALKISNLDYREQFFEKRNFIAYPHKHNIDFGTADVTFEKSLPEGSERTSDHDYVGHVDVANERTIYGWAADRKRPNVPITVSLYDGSGRIATTTAALTRSDLAAYLGDNGRHGFAIPFPTALKDGRPHRISLRFETNGNCLTVSDYTTIKQSESASH